MQLLELHLSGLRMRSKVGLVPRLIWPWNETVECTTVLRCWAGCPEEATFKMSESVRISVFRSNEDIVKKCGKVGCGTH